MSPQRIKHLLSRMSHYSIAHHGGHMDSNSLDPVTYADWQGGLADLRAAGNIASGVPLDLIDPSMGTTSDPGGWTPVTFEPVQPVAADGNYLIEVVA